MFTTPQDFYNHVTKTVSAFPKTPEQVKTVLEKVKNVYAVEAKKAIQCANTFKKVATGDASLNEINAANKNAMEVACAARFAAFMTIPGAIFMIPALSKIHLDLTSEDFVPNSVRQEFDL